MKLVISTDVVVVSRPFNGISLNGEREYLLDDMGHVLHFANEEVARAYLTERGYVFFEFLEFEHETLPCLTDDIEARAEED